MKPRSLLVAVVLLAVLSAIVWWAKKHPQSSNESTATTKIVDIPSDQVQQITVKKKDGPSLVLNRDNGKWQITQPAKYPADQDSVSSLTSALSPLNADSVVEDKSVDAAKYGLKSPSMTVTIGLKGGKSDTIEFGDDAPAGGGPLQVARLTSMPVRLPVAPTVNDCPMTCVGVSSMPPANERFDWSTAPITGVPVTLTLRR